jgi:hypothetical protein
LRWRDEIIASGVTERRDVTEQLKARQREWARMPNAIVAGATPLKALAAERARVRMAQGPYAPNV